MAKEVIVLDEEQVTEVTETQEAKPQKEIKIFGRVITVKKADKQANTEAEAKPNQKKIDKKKVKRIVGGVLIGAGLATVAVAKALSKAGKTVEVEDPSAEYLPDVDDDYQDQYFTEDEALTEPEQEIPENAETVEE